MMNNNPVGFDVNGLLDLFGGKADLTEMFILKEKLREHGIPFERDPQAAMNGEAIKYPSKDNFICSVICHFGSYGYEEGLLEIMGLLTDEERQNDEVVGFLTGAEVFERIRAHYENNCSHEEKQEV